MKYYFSKKVSNATFDQVLEKVADVLKTQGFGILTEIDVQATMKKKLGKDMQPYKSLGACNPSFAYQALQAGSKIGTMLPFNIIIQELKDGAVEVEAVDLIASMQAVENKALAKIASEDRFKLVIVNLQ